MPRGSARRTTRKSCGHHTDCVCAFYAVTRYAPEPLAAEGYAVDAESGRLLAFPSKKTIGHEEQGIVDGLEERHWYGMPPIE